VPKIPKLQLLVDSEKFLQSMISRLYYDDANGLKHFRLIYESDGDYLVVFKRAIFKPSFFINTIVLDFKDYSAARKKVEEANSLFWPDKKKEILVYYARPPTKKTKIFEKVKGAVITGKVSGRIKNNAKISISLKLKTKFNRIFIYKQTTKIEGSKYIFIVPYPTTEMRGNDYSYDIKPLGNYQIQTNSKIVEVVIPEKAVMFGEIIRKDISR
jgi:asparagine N-glycosylation enzyme membrane subunit Stt3